jgi:hypothetical protein
MDAIDILLDSDGDLPLIPRHGRGIDVIAQRIATAIRTVRREWFLDLNAGLPYLEWMQVKPAPVAEIVAETRRAIEAIDGVARTEGFEGAHDLEDRRVSITGRIYTEYGELTLAASPLGSPDGPNSSASVQLWDLSGALLVG